MSLFLFFLLSFLCLGSVVWMIISKNQAYNALLLVLAFVSLGGIFGLLDAPFIAVIQILIYAGAIMILFIFVIMMINLRQGISPEKRKRVFYLSFVLAFILITEFIFALRSSSSLLGDLGGDKTSSPSELGRLLFTKYIYPFEITSILILAALVGAIVLVKKKEEG